nr:MAG TPA: hypothetical protein [Caudoviricetes sp.]
MLACSSVFLYVFDRIDIFCYNQSIEKISISLILSLARLV